MERLEECFWRLRPELIKFARKHCPWDLIEDALGDTAVKVFSREPEARRDAWIWKLFRSEIAHLTDSKTPRKKGALARSLVVSTENVSEEILRPLSPASRASDLSPAKAKSRAADARKIRKNRASSAWQKAHPDRARAAVDKYREANPDRVRALQDERGSGYGRTFRQSHKEEERQRLADYRAKNPDKVAEQNRRSNAKRAKKQEPRLDIAC